MGKHPCEGCVDAVQDINGVDGYRCDYIGHNRRNLSAEREMHRQVHRTERRRGICVDRPRRVRDAAEAQRLQRKDKS